MAKKKRSGLSLLGKGLARKAGEALSGRKARIERELAKASGKAKKKK